MLDVAHRDESPAAQGTVSPHDHVFPKPGGVIWFDYGLDQYPPNFPVSQMRGQGVCRATEWYSVDRGCSWHRCKDKRRHEAILAGAAETVEEFLEAVRT